MPADDDKPAVRVTLDRIYEQVLATKDLVSPLPAQVHDHEVRIRAAESFIDRLKGQRALLAGLALAFGGTTGTIASLIVTHAK